MQISNNAHLILLHSPLRPRSYVILVLKLSITDGNLKLCMCAHAIKEAQKPPEHTSKHVISQNF